MTRNLVLLTLMLYGMNCLGRSDSNDTQPGLKAQLEQMGAADQEVRNKIAPFLKEGDLQSDEFAAAAQEMTKVDAENLTKLEKIIDQFGWPDVRVVGKDAGNAAFLILQHSPLTAQQKLLPTFREAVASGKARPSDLAMLEDRVRTGEGKAQLYGTQISMGPDGKPRVSPIEDPQGLDARRAAAGLPPMDVYLEYAQSGFGQEIDRSALTIQGSNDSTLDTSRDQSVCSVLSSESPHAEGSRVIVKGQYVQHAHGAMLLDSGCKDEVLFLTYLDGGPYFQFCESDRLSREFGCPGGMNGPIVTVSGALSRRSDSKNGSLMVEKILAYESTRTGERVEP
jgi:hypothetical protein